MWFQGAERWLVKVSPSLRFRLSQILLILKIESLIVILIIPSCKLLWVFSWYGPNQYGPLSLFDLAWVDYAFPYLCLGVIVGLNLILDHFLFKEYIFDLFLCIIIFYYWPNFANGPHSNSNKLFFDIDFFLGQEKFGWRSGRVKVWQRFQLWSLFLSFHGGVVCGVVTPRSDGFTHILFQGFGSEAIVGCLWWTQSNDSIGNGPIIHLFWGKAWVLNGFPQINHLWNVRNRLSVLLFVNVFICSGELS